MRRRDWVDRVDWDEVLAGVVVVVDGLLLLGGYAVMLFAPESVVVLGVSVATFVLIVVLTALAVGARGGD